MSALRTFMLNLLSSHNGDVQLVADNAALTMEKAPPSRPNQPALAAMGGSSHSCTRWETDEPSPGRASDKGAKTLGPVLALSLQRRPHPLLCKNSSPACPIRKLSPKVHPDESHEDVISPSPGLRLESKRLVKNMDRLAISRPPLSPRKNKGRSIVMPGGRKATAPKKKLSYTKPLRPPDRIISKRNRPLAELQAPAASIAPSPPVWTTTEQIVASGGKSADGPTRGLSKTLGTDVTEQAPICPTRRPSTQSHELAEGDRENEAARQFPYTVVSGRASKMPSTVGFDRASTRPTDFEIERDILVLPPLPELGTGEGDKHPDDDDDLQSKDRLVDSNVRGTGGCSSPIFLHRFTKRR